MHEPDSSPRCLVGELSNQRVERQEVSDMTANSPTARALTRSAAPTGDGPAPSTGFDSAHDAASSSGAESTADRVEIEALRAEFTDAVMMRDYNRLASLFTAAGALRIPDIPVDLAGQDAIRAWGAEVPQFVEYLVQTAHPGTIRLDGDTASGRVFIHELVSARDGRSGENYAIYHDRYQRTVGGWRFTERVYEIKYLDTTPLAGGPPNPANTPFEQPASASSSGGR
jgi:ketosteroid isomerase-like protein